MSKEQDSLAVTYERVRTVFGSQKVSKQESPAFNMMLERALQRNHPNPVPEIEIVGIKEMLGFVWDSALSVLSKNSEDSATSPSTTSASPESKSMPSSDTSPASRQQTDPASPELPDLQNLPEDPILGVERGRDKRLQAQSTTENKPG